MKKNFLKKNKLIVISLSIVLVLSVASIIFAKVNANSESKEFQKSGYVILANEQAESKKYAFNNGTKYEKKLLGGFVFHDVQKNKVELNKENFVYFDDNSYSSLAKGVLLSLQDVGSGQAIHHYSITSGMDILKNNKGYQIQNEKEPVNINEALWKISDTKYLLLSNEINIHFDEKDIRNAGQYLEINYIDKGVIQLVTKDNVWQTVSTNAYAQTEEGSQISLFDQLIKVKEKQMLMSKLVINDDANIELSPLEQKKQAVPDINIEGEDGTSGESGTGGEDGTSGNNGTHGTSGGDGNTGNKGNAGGTGASGSNAGNESTAKTAIPQLSIINWKVDATGISGEYKVKDENAMLSDYLDISVYEAGSGNKIDCVDENDQSGSFNYFEGGTFKTNSEITPLTPDTEYRLIISGKYEMSGLPFEREFVSRVFYTDSLGVFTEKENVTTDSIKISVTKKDYSKAIGAEIYLLSAEQAKGFDPTTANSYIKESIDFASGTDKMLTFTQNKHNVKSDTNYIVRMVLKLEGEKKYLTQQSLNFFTLKQTPKISSEPYAIANRQLGAFELFGGQVIDPDNAIVSYTYEIYNAELNELVKSMEVKPSAVNQATILYIDNQVIQYGTKYIFKVITVYNDNEKIVELQSKFSPEFSLSTANLPAVRFESTEIEYNKIKGQLIIDLNGSKISASEESPLDVAIECEGVFSKVLSFESLNDPDIIKTERQIIITINENHLSADKMYRFTVTGKVDLGDIVSRRVIGSIVKQTPSLTKIKAVWGVNQSSGNAISRTLKFVGEEDVSWDKDSYDAKTLSKVVVELYRGAGDGKVFMASQEFIDTIEDPYQSSLTENFITKGIDITEDTFGYPAASLTAQTYTIVVEEVRDYTATVTSPEYINIGNFSNYSNEYEVSSREVQVSKATQPPSLPEWSSINNQVSADPIYNKDAGSFNQPVNKDLADDTIVGYKLKANYDNYAKLGRKISYYVFESNAYDNMVNAKENPIYDFKKGVPIGEEDGKWLVKKEIASNALNVPTMAIFFENKNNNADYDFNGTYIRFAGDLVTDKNTQGEYEILEGMTRGYKYTFAYTLNYSPTGGMDGESTLLYPYEHPAYNNLYNQPIIPQAYVLNSGTKNAPKTNPTFEAFPWINKKGISMEVRYKYKDVDKTIPEGSTVSVNYGNGYIPIPDAKISSEQNTWSTINITSLPASSGSILEPKVISNLYNLNYGEPNTLSILKFPLDNEGTFSTSTAQRGIDYSINQSQLSNNILQIRLQNASSSPEKYFDAYKNRITSLGVTLESTSDKTKYDFILPYNSANNTATLSTSKIFNLLNKEIKVSVTVYYDTGELGWGGMNDSSFAFQYIKTNANNVELGNYLNYDQTSGTLNSRSAVGGSHYNIYKENGNEVWIDENLNSSRIGMKAHYSGAEANRFYNVKPTYYGISEDISDNPKHLNVFTPKKIQSTSLTSCEDNSDIFTLDLIAPSVTTNANYTSTLNALTLYNVAFNGIETIDVNASNQKIVYVELTDSTGKKRVEELNVNNWTTPKSYTINKLIKDESYYIRMYTYVNGKQVFLLNGNSAEGGLWSMNVSMKGSVNISRFNATYKPTSYANKQILVSYILDQLSGFFIEFNIYDTNGNIVYTAQELKDDKIFSGYTPGQVFLTNMETAFNLPVGNKKLLAGRTYILKATARSYVGEIVSDEEVGSASTQFTIPVAGYPVPFVNLVSEFDSATNKLFLDAEFSLVDTDRIIMSDYKNGKSVSTYFIRLFKIKDGKEVDITSSDIKRRAYETGKNYHITLDDVDPNTNYFVKFYTAIDTDLDGKEDRTEIETSIDTLSEDELLKVLDDLYLTEEYTTTPGENGIGFGKPVSVTNTGGDKSRVSIVYVGATNLNTISKIKYTVSSNNGHVTKEINNENGDKFKLQRVNDNYVPGYYLLDIPEMFEINGLYKIKLVYYLKDRDGKDVIMSEQHSVEYIFNK